MVSTLKRFITDRYELSDYPTLIYQEQQWAAAKPLLGLTVVDATPVFGNTLAKYIPLLEAGANLAVGISEVMPRDEEVVDFLRSIGMKILSPGELLECDIVLDCAGAFSGVAARVGYVELTRSGVEKYLGCSKPVYMADTSLIKRIETSLGTGDAYFRAMTQLGYEEWEGKTLVIFGKGKVGIGLAVYGEKKGARVVVFDENSPCEEVLREIARAYAVVTVTGVRGAMAMYANALIGSGALLANMGVEDEYGDKVPSTRVLGEKRPLNFILREPTHLRYIETTMALHNFGTTKILKQQNRGGLLEPSAELEEELLAIVRAYGRIGEEIDFTNLFLSH